MTRISQQECRGILELPPSTFWRIFSLVNSHNLLGNPLIPLQALNTNFHLEPKNRKAKI